MRIVVGVAALLAAWAMPAAAGDLVYSPVNPSFGGNALNSSHLLGLANAQRTATAKDAKTSTDGSSGGGSGETPGSTDADLFVRQLQGRLLSALASQVTEAIFGSNPQEAGTVRFGDTTVTFERSIDSIRLIISDATGVTEIVVPQLVTVSPSATALSTGIGSTGDLTTNIDSGSLTGGSLSGSLDSGLN